MTTAEDLVYDGGERLSSDTREAKRCFARAISVDPDVADAYNGLAEVDMARGNLAAAEKHYLTAYEKARASLGTEDKKAFALWARSLTWPLPEIYCPSRHRGLDRQSKKDLSSVRGGRNEQWESD